MEPYISIITPNSGASGLEVNYKRSLHPRVVELYLLETGGGALRNDLAAENAVHAPMDFLVDVQGKSIDEVMQMRVDEGISEIESFVPENQPNLKPVPIPVSADPAFYAARAFDYAKFIAHGGKPLRQKWVGNLTAEGTYGLGVDAQGRDANGVFTGHPKLNPNIIVEHSVDPQGCILHADKYGFEVSPGTKDSHRYQMVAAGVGGGFVFKLIDPVDSTVA